MPRETVKRSDLAGDAGYGYCASHSRFFWGFRLYLVCTLDGMPVVDSRARRSENERSVKRSSVKIDISSSRTKTTANALSPGVYSLVTARLLALALADGIWHNWVTDASAKRSCIAYDH